MPSQRIFLQLLWAAVLLRRRSIFQKRGNQRRCLWPSSVRSAASKPVFCSAVSRLLTLILCSYFAFISAFSSSPTSFINLPRAALSGVSAVRRPLISAFLSSTLAFMDPVGGDVRILPFDPRVAGDALLAHP